MCSGVTGLGGNLDHGNLERDGVQAIRRNACAKDLDNSAVDGDVRSGLGMGGHIWWIPCIREGVSAAQLGRLRGRQDPDLKGEPAQTRLTPLPNQSPAHACSGGATSSKSAGVNDGAYIHTSCCASGFGCCGLDPRIGASHRATFAFHPHRTRRFGLVRCLGRACCVGSPCCCGIERRSRHVFFTRTGGVGRGSGLDGARRRSLRGPAARPRAAD